MQQPLPMLLLRWGNHLCCRYFICDKKLAALGWRERTPWADGLRRTVDWYLKNGLAAYWERGDVENALRPHPIIQAHTNQASA